MSALQLRLDDEDPWIIEERIFDIVNNLLQPSSTLSTTAAARALDGLFPENRPEEDQPEGKARESAGTFLWYMWSVFHKVAQQVPHASPAQDRLAALVNDLRQLSSDTPIISLESWGGDFRLWESLPLLGPTLTEECDRIDETSAGGRQRWRNVNAYMARLTRDGSVDLRYHGVMALTGALEGELVRAHAHAHAHPARVESELTPGPALDSRVCVAADWISLCGPTLFEEKEDVASTLGGPLWDGKPGLSRARWQLWEARFGAISEHDKIDDETRRVAREARQRMQEIERAGTTA